MEIGVACRDSFVCKCRASSLHSPALLINDYGIDRPDGLLRSNNVRHAALTRVHRETVSSRRVTPLGISKSLKTAYQRDAIADRMNERAFRKEKVYRDSPILCNKASTCIHEKH